MAKAQRSIPKRKPNRAQRRRALSAGAEAVFPEPAAESPAADADAGMRFVAAPPQAGKSSAQETRVPGGRRDAATGEKDQWVGRHIRCRFELAHVFELSGSGSGTAAGAPPSCMRSASEARSAARS